MIFKVKLQVQPNTWKALNSHSALPRPKAGVSEYVFSSTKSTVLNVSIWIRPSQFFRSALNLTDTIRKLHVFSLLSFHFGHGNKCKALRYTPFVTPSVRDCSLCLILQVAQCFLDLRNLANKSTESKAFLNSSQQLCHVVSTCSCFFCSFSAAAAPPTSANVNLSSEKGRNEMFS